MISGLQRGHFGFTSFLILLQVQFSAGRVVEVVRRIFVLLPLFEQGVSKPVLDDLQWQACLLGHFVQRFLSWGIVDVKVGPQDFQLVI